jgi:hypothetical protein
MTDTFGSQNKSLSPIEELRLKSLFQEEGPGRTGAPRLLPVIDAPPFIRKVDDDRSFGDYFQSDKNVVDRVKEYFEPKYEQGSFGSFQRDDGRVVRFGMPEEFSQEEILRALEDIKNVPAGSTLADRRDVAEVAKRLEGLPEDDPIFAESPLDALSADIDKTLADLKTTPSQTQKTAITALAQLNQEVAEDEMGRGISDQVVEDAFVAGMDDFLETIRGAGPADTEMTIDDYKKEFADATGIDISGKVDKSNALMAFGLALMQNKAGRGFNVGKMLAAIGEAGQTAMPELEKAKEKARAGALAAGKYALQTRATDRATDAANQEKMMNRSKYWVYKKGGKGQEFASFDEGEFVDLNKYELNKLLNTPDFDKNYEFIDASDRFAILEKRAEGVDLGDQWDPKLEDVSLIGGSSTDLPPALRVAAYAANPNYEGTLETKYKLAENPKGVQRRLVQAQNDINKSSDRLRMLLENIENGISIPDQLVSSVVQAGRNLGFDMGGVSTVAEAKQELKNIAIDEALRILQESGRTISEGERVRVEERVGKIRLGNADPELIRNQVEHIYNMVVTKPQRDLDTAISGFEENFGFSIMSLPTEDELRIINEKRKARGEPPVTMDDFQ